MDKTIYLCLAHMSEEGIEQKYVKEAFDTNWVVPLGPNVNAFEEDLKRFVGEGKEVVALSAGTAAVHLALLACGVGQGDEVIVQSFTFCASSHPVTYLGAVQQLAPHYRHQVTDYIMYVTRSQGRLLGNHLSQLLCIHGSSHFLQTQMPKFGTLFCRQRRLSCIIK